MLNDHPPLSLPLSLSPLLLSLYQVEQLTSQLKEKADWCSELLLSSEQLRRELGERDEEIDKLESRIRELEQALLASAESLEKVRRGRGEEEEGEDGGCGMETDSGRESSVNNSCAAWHRECVCVCEWGCR